MVNGSKTISFPSLAHVRRRVSTPPVGQPNLFLWFISALGSSCKDCPFITLGVLPGGLLAWGRGKGPGREICPEEMHKVGRAVDGLRQGLTHWGRGVPGCEVNVGFAQGGRPPRRRGFHTILRPRRPGEVKIETKICLLWCVRERSIFGCFFVWSFKIKSWQKHNFRLFLKTPKNRSASHQICFCPCGGRYI